ncbi:hypothetical protein EDD18DRAFT_506639 [Armillaria luteobubalina]|uniref:Uncharacterized protein n=1 Tax=Armillaria luteobubalina TaxID=153913 RepID=A0AA39PX66_9AGAR|nr:hypothetical protein EDD18DRAFT_506639 [Armillaria luteobubalina]
MRTRWHPLEFFSSPFDPSLTYVSSSVPILRHPIVLASVRLLLAVYVLVTLLVSVVWAGVVSHDIDGYFSYFTHLTYIGLCSYFFASGVQTLVYARNNTYLLRTWPFAKTLQFLHVWLHSTVVTFPFVVTITFWVLLSSSSTFSSVFNTWNNISVHALNSAYALFEVLLTNAPPPPLIFMLADLVLLGGYLGVAYITYATQGFYSTCLVIYLTEARHCVRARQCPYKFGSTYSVSGKISSRHANPFATAYNFLDPRQQGSFLAAYIAGIAVGYIIIFGIVSGMMVIRRRIVNKDKYNNIEGEKEMSVRPSTCGSSESPKQDVERPKDGDRW